MRTASRLSPVEKLTQRFPAWVLNSRRTLPVSTSQIRAVASIDAVARRVQATGTKSHTLVTDHFASPTTTNKGFLWNCIFHVCHAFAPINITSSNKCAKHRHSKDMFAARVDIIYNKQQLQCRVLPRHIFVELNMSHILCMQSWAQHDHSLRVTFYMPSYQLYSCTRPERSASSA